MKIKSFTCIGGASDAPIVECEFKSSICFLRGRGSDEIMDLIRETLGDRKPHSYLDNYNDGHFVLHGDVEMDNKDYRVCYIRNAEDGENRIAVNFNENDIEYSREDTDEYLKKCAALNKTQSNILIGTATVSDDHDLRPIFIYDYFDRLDEAVDITPILDSLASLGRQVFVAVCSSYHDVRHESVQMCGADLFSSKKEAFAADIFNMVQGLIDGNL